MAASMTQSLILTAVIALALHSVQVSAFGAGNIGESVQATLLLLMSLYEESLAHHHSFNQCHRGPELASWRHRRHTAEHRIGTRGGW